MDDTPKGPRARSCSVAQSAPHQVLVCKPCKHKGDACEPGFALFKQLRSAISPVGVDAAFELSGTTCLAGCGPVHGEPCINGRRVTKNATRLFGDINPDQSRDDLIGHARDFATRDASQATGRHPPSGFCATTLARIPAAMIVTREGRVL